MIESQNCDVCGSRWDANTGSMKYITHLNAHVFEQPGKLKLTCKRCGYSWHVDPVNQKED